MTTIKYVAYKDAGKIDAEGNPVFTIKEVENEYQSLMAVASLLSFRKKGFPRTIDIKDDNGKITVTVMTEVTKTKDREKKVKEIPDFMD